MRFRLESYPLRHARQASIHEARRRHVRLGCGRMSWLAANARRWATVQLAKGPRGWMLAYEGMPSTGPFDTKQKAIAWFARGGR
jgi:hypothetical protein